MKESLKGVKREWECSGIYEGERGTREFSEGTGGWVNKGWTLVGRSETAKKRARPYIAVTNEALAKDFISQQPPRSGTAM